MNDNTKIEVSREVMNAMIANTCKNGFTTQNKTLLFLLKEENELDNFNFKVIDKVLDKYSPFIKRRNS
ncbi:MAG: hypothetical protein IJW32_00990 [Clostridia bacterium]|nr:hypothetical protein [Clostridia bacterium]